MVTPAFSAFPASEHRERLIRARHALAEAGYDGCIVVAPENLFYLASYDSIGSYIGPQALIFSVKDDQDPTLMVRNLDLPLAKETTWITDIRTYQLNADDVGSLLFKMAQEHGFDEGRIGLELNSYAVTAGYAASIVKALPSARFEDSGPVLSGLQYIKSPGELTYVREAAHYANIGVESARAALRAGMKETALCAAVEGAMRAAVTCPRFSGPRIAGGF